MQLRLQYQLLALGFRCVKPIAPIPSIAAVVPLPPGRGILDLAEESTFPIFGIAIF